MIKQKTKYGCGLYAVANATNNPDFVTPERLEASKGGNIIGQLSKWMQEDGQNFYIEVLYYNHLGTKLPKEALGYTPSGENIMLLPILLNVRFSDEGKNHLVGGQISKDGTLHLFDSLNEDIVTTTLWEINDLYHHVYGIFIFADVDTGDYAFI